MYSLTINVVSVLIAAVGSMVLGFIWYGPVFRKPWMNGLGLTEADFSKVSKQQMILSYVGTFLCALVTAFVLALFIKNLFVPTIIQAVQIGFWASIGFMAPTHIANFLFSPKNRSFKLLGITIGYYFLSFLLQSIIIFIFS